METFLIIAVIWYLIGAAGMAASIYLEYQKGSPINLGDLAFCILISLMGPIAAGIGLYNTIDWDKVIFQKRDPQREGKEPRQL